LNQRQGFVELAEIVFGKSEKVIGICGTVREIELCNLDELSQEIAQKTGFRNIEHQVVFRGECQKCASHP